MRQNIVISVRQITHSSTWTIYVKGISSARLVVESVLRTWMENDDSSQCLSSI